MHVLVLAEVDKALLESEFPNISFDYKGYASDFVVLNRNILLSIISKYEIVISEFDTIDKEVLDKADKLRLLICCRGGVGTVVDVGYARTKGIVVKNTPGRNSTAVAEYVIGQIISEDRCLAICNQLVHTEDLQKRKFNKPKEYRDALWGMDSASPYHVFRGRGLQNITLGLIGYGRVGKTVEAMARLLGMNVIIYDHSSGELIPKSERVDFEVLLRRSDIVSLHCTNKEHRTLLDKQALENMKHGSWLINTARGDLIDEDALIEALEDRHIAKAILDVTRDEPLPVGSKLVSAPNLVITPHIAGSTDVVIENVTRMVVTYLDQYFETRKSNS